MLKSFENQDYRILACWERHQEVHPNKIHFAVAQEHTGERLCSTVSVQIGNIFCNTGNEFSGINLVILLSQSIADLVQTDYTKHHNQNIF